MLHSAIAAAVLAVAVLLAAAAPAVAVLLAAAALAVAAFHGDGCPCSLACLAPAASPGTACDGGMFSSLGAFLFGLDIGYIAPILECASFMRDVAYLEDWRNVLAHR